MLTNNIKYKENIKKIHCTISPLNWLLKIFSLDCHGEKLSRRSSCLLIVKSAITAIVLTSINCFTLYYKFIYFYETLIISVTYTDVLQMVFDVFQYTVDLYFVHKYGSEVYSEYINQYAFIDGMLGTIDFANFKRRLIKIMIITFSMYISSSIFDYVIWAIGFGILGTTAFSIAYVYLLIKILTNLHLIFNVMHIESRMRVIGDLIQECYCASPSCSARLEDAVIKKNWFYNDTSRTSASKLCPLRSIPRLKWEEVKWLSRCYLLLTEQASFINKTFGIRILLNCLSLLIDMVRFTNLAVRVLRGSQYTGYDDGSYPAITAVWRTATCVTVIVGMVVHCESAYRQHERIISLIDHLVVDKSLDDKLMTAYSQFRCLVQSRPIIFHMDNFIKIDYPLLVSITSVYVTYTIILIQSI